MSLCKQCGLEVKWQQDLVCDKKSGARRLLWQCYDADGRTHWDLCSKTRFERIKKTGEFFQTKKSEGYKTVFKKSGVQMTMEKAKIRRAKIPLSGACGNCVPPWEVCEECPDKIFKKV